MVLMPARPDMLEACDAILRDGRAFQREQGFVQWTEDYPNRETIQKDIRAGKGYVLQVDGRVAGYVCLDFGGEPAYAAIRGAWHTQPPYAVVHRLALHRDFRGRGLTDAAFRQMEALCRARNVLSIRADTDFPNTRMQHILEKNGFTRCGTVVFQGSEKLAYEKALAPDPAAGAAESHEGGM